MAMGGGTGSSPCHVFAFTFLFPPETRGAWDSTTSCSNHPQGRLQGVSGGQRAPLTDSDMQQWAECPLWAIGQWSALGAVGDTGRVGADLAVVQGRLYISGGVDEGRGGGFDDSVAMWGGTYADLPQPLDLRPPLRSLRSLPQGGECSDQQTTLTTIRRSLS